MDNQKKEKKEEGLRGWWVDVSLGSPLVGFRRSQIVPKFWGFYKNWGFYLEGVWLWRVSGDYSHEIECSVLVEVAGIEPAPPNGLQYHDIINYYYAMKITNGTGVMGQV